MDFCIYLDTQTNFHICLACRSHTMILHHQPDARKYMYIYTARCVSHTLKECVGYHTLTKIRVFGTLEFSKIAQ